MRFEKFSKSIVAAGMLASTAGNTLVAFAEGDGYYGDPSTGYDDTTTAETGTIHIVGNEGQNLIGKSFYVYQLFTSDSASGTITYDWTSDAKVKGAIQKVVAAEINAAAQTSVTPNQITAQIAVDYMNALHGGERTEITVKDADGQDVTVEVLAHPDQLESSASAYRQLVDKIRDQLVADGATPSTVTASASNVDAATNTLTISGLPLGYYIVDEQSVAGTHAAASLIIADTVNPDSTINIKSDFPEVFKQIQEDDNNVSWNDVGDYEIGQTVPYRYEATIANMNGYASYKMAFHDTMDTALTFDDTSVEIILHGADKDYTLATNEYQVLTGNAAKTASNNDPHANDADTFQIAIPDVKAIYDREIKALDENDENVYEGTIEVKYSAKLNENAAKNPGRPGFENDVRLEFSNNPDINGSGDTGYTPYDTVVAFTYELDVNKRNEKGVNLANAKFRLYRDEACTDEVITAATTNVDGVENGYTVDKSKTTGGTDLVSDADGNFVIFGLDQGTYYLKEVAAPTGYRVLGGVIKLDVVPTIDTANRTTKEVSGVETDGYTKGDGATDKTLTALTATADYLNDDGNWLFGSKPVNASLDTDLEKGNAQMIVLNKTGERLPITGGPGALITLGAGAAILLASKKFSKKED